MKLTLEVRRRLLFRATFFADGSCSCFFGLDVVACSEMRGTDAPLHAWVYIRARRISQIQRMIDDIHIHIYKYYIQSVLKTRVECYAPAPIAQLFKPGSLSSVIRQINGMFLLYSHAGIVVATLCFKPFALLGIYENIL